MTRAEFHRLSDVPPEAEWFANLDNENTRRAYRNDVGDFIRFAAIERPDDLRQVTRAHVLQCAEKPRSPVAVSGEHPPKAFRALGTA